MTASEIETTWAPRILSLLRIMAAVLFMAHGIQKLFGFPVVPSFGMPVFGTLIWFAAVLELAGGILLAIGLLTRPIAFLLSGEMAIAYFYAHAGRSPFPIVNGGELAIVYCFLFLFLAAAGAGAWSVDAALRQRGGRVAAWA